MNNKEIIYLIGLPCSGKSTWLKEHCPNHVIISNDLIVEEYAEIHGLCYNDAWKSVNFKYVKRQLMERFERAVSEKRNIVIDNTNMTSKARSVYNANGYMKKAVVFNISENERQRREQKRLNETGKFIPEEAIKQMKSIFKYPSFDEGFDEIVEVCD